MSVCHETFIYDNFQRFAPNGFICICIDKKTNRVRIWSQSTKPFRRKFWGFFLRLFPKKFHVDIHPRKTAVWKTLQWLHALLPRVSPSEARLARRLFFRHKWPEVDGSSSSAQSSTKTWLRVSRGDICSQYQSCANTSPPRVQQFMKQNQKTDGQRIWWRWQ